MLQKSIVPGLLAVLLVAAPALAVEPHTGTMSQSTETKASAAMANHYLQLAYQDAMQAHKDLAAKNSVAARESLASLRTNLNKAAQAEKNPKFQQEIANIRREHSKTIALIKSNPKAALEASKNLELSFREPMATLATMGGGGGMSEETKQKLKEMKQHNK